MTTEPHKADATEESRPLPPVTQPANVRRVARDGTAIDRIDVLAEETPIALVYNGISHAVMMASPADLAEFALGFSVSEGIADSKDDVGAIEAVAVEAGIEVRIELSSRAFWRLKERRRTLAGRTGCGLCGVDSLEQTVRVMQPVTADLKAPLDAIHRALDNLPEAQTHNRATRSMHAAAFATPQGELKLVREDVGRHNALDKLIGALLRAGMDPASGVCLITSRCSYEMVQKAVVTGFPILAAVSAPTLMARRLAEAHNLTLIALARHDSAVLVSHPERVY
ncbi:formate dehydrogenase accessory sulfurtransferase FdhD [Dongia deserti]|uniref:formate dehydrogenase accessory sulfurtransferase FdhD n=1 Tax=Dongia deserti TaxID=2268030 RepID=UPI000E652C00|nr:formate dehydrogenase accessory sulfurtransferase FdhD [Dongia deserti]